MKNKVRNRQEDVVRLHKAVSSIAKDTNSFALVAIQPVAEGSCPSVFVCEPHAPEHDVSNAVSHGIDALMSMGLAGIMASTMHIKGILKSLRECAEESELSEEQRERVEEVEDRLVAFNARVDEFVAQFNTKMIRCNEKL